MPMILAGHLATHDGQPHAAAMNALIAVPASLARRSSEAAELFVSTADRVTKLSAYGAVDCGRRGVQQMGSVAGEVMHFAKDAVGEVVHGAGEAMGQVARGTGTAVARLTPHESPKGWEKEEAFGRVGCAHSRNVLSKSPSTDEDEPSGADRATWLSRAPRSTKRRTHSRESSDEVAYLASQSAVTPSRRALRAPPDTAMSSLEWVLV